MSLVLNCQVLTELESVIKRDYLSPTFETTIELLSAYKSSVSANGSLSAPILPWIPNTTAAVALRLTELDSAIYYTEQLKLESQKEEVRKNLVRFTVMIKKNHLQCLFPRDF